MQSVSYRYGNAAFALQDVSLSIGKGEFVAVAGRNGSGKTTLTKLVMCLIKPSGGNIQFEGVDTKKLTPANMARHIGYVFQNPDKQIFHDTVAQEVAYGPKQLGFDLARIQTVVESALVQTGLVSYAQSYPRSLSKGQKQMVAIASALAMEPEVLILDEPTSGQDAANSRKLMELLTRLNEAGRTIILVTHDMDILSRYAKRAIVMAGGKKVFDDTIAELFSTRHDFAAWGLREPVIPKLSRGLGGVSISVVTEAAELCQQIQLAAGGQNNV